MRELKKRMRRNEQFWPGCSISRAPRCHPQLCGSSTMFTAPHFGFENAEDYYYRAAAPCASPIVSAFQRHHHG